MELNQTDHELSRAKPPSIKDDLINHIALMITMAMFTGFLCWFCFSELDRPWFGIYSILIYIVMCIAAWYSWRSGDCREV